MKTTLILYNETELDALDKIEEWEGNHEILASRAQPHSKTKAYILEDEYVMFVPHDLVVDLIKTNRAMDLFLSNQCYIDLARVKKLDMLEGKKPDVENKKVWLFGETPYVILEFLKGNDIE